MNYEFRVCCLFFFLCLNFLAISQPKAGRKAIANTHIEQLRDGVLLVQLDSKYGEIYVLQKYLKQQEANALKKEQGIRNKEICLAFREEFNFSEVYFYYKFHNEQLINVDYEKVVFYNDKLEIDYDFDLTAQPFYIAAFEDIDRTGLHIYDNKLQPLKKPFPLKEKEYRFIFIKRDAFEIVNSWNEKLHNYLAKYQYTKKIKQ